MKLRHFSKKSYTAFFNITVLLLILVFGGCASKENKDFNLTIVVSQKLGESSHEKLPQDIIELCFPIDDCSKYNFIPKPTLYRLGFEQETEKSLITPLEKRFAGNLKNPKLLKREIEKYLSTQTIGEVFSLSNPAINLKSQFEAYLANLSSHTLIIFYSENNQQAKKYNVPVFNTIDDIRDTISQELCDKGVKKVVVFLDPPLSDAAPQFKNITQDDHTLQEIIEMNKTASQIKDEIKRKEALEKVAYVIQKTGNPQNWRFVYELMKNRIYGKEHHEAFDLLKKAVIIAIEHNQGKYLLDLIEEEKDGELRKLSRGHKQEWEKILMALKESDTSLLHAHEQVAGKH